MNITIKNEKIEVTISTFGAELQNIIKDNKEYLWQGDKEFWGRRSPVLFPIVGGLKDKKYIYNGKEYSMSQHGFARDKEFSLLSQSEDSAFFYLEDDEDTLSKYPFHFRLEIGYTLEGSTINVIWKVYNKELNRIYYSIGAHPAFNLPTNIKREDCYIHFDNIPNNITDVHEGLADSNNNMVDLYKFDKDGYLPISNNLFDNDAIVIENNQVNEILLCDNNKKSFIKVSFPFPLVGVWSPKKDNCPFVCIEPWVGRCDEISSDHYLINKKWIQHLRANESKSYQYQITIL